MQKGHLLEQIIGDFSSKFFMKDFVILNPKYNRAGHEKELADLLLVLDDKCIVVSVKGTDGNPKSEAKLKNWLAKRTGEGLRQAKGGINWLSKVSFSGRDLWGEIRDFEAGSLYPICGIALLECSQQPFLSIEFDAREPESDIPLHYLSLNDFLNVVHWSGSIWDLFHYFSEREGIRDVFTGINQEHPVFGYYFLRSNDLSGLLTIDKAELEKLRDFHNLHLFESIPKYKEREKLVAHLNAVVYQLHTRHPSIEDFMPAELMKNVEPLETRTAYLKMAAMLNGLPMSQKVWIGRGLDRYLTNLRNSGMSGCFAMKPAKSELAFAFVCFSRKSRTERISEMLKILPAALFSHGVTEGLGVAFDADDSNSGFDLIWIREYKTFSVYDKRLAEFLFPNRGSMWVADPFGQARPFRPE